MSGNEEHEPEPRPRKHWIPAWIPLLVVILLMAWTTGRYVMVKYRICGMWEWAPDAGRYAHAKGVEYTFEPDGSLLVDYGSLNRRQNTTYKIRFFSGKLEFQYAQMRVRIRGDQMTMEDADGKEHRFSRIRKD
jgi:hypothetical protein